MSETSESDTRRTGESVRNVRRVYIDSDGRTPFGRPMHLLKGQCSARIFFERGVVKYRISPASTRHYRLKATMPRGVLPLLRRTK
jgi:hypothetical protein